MQHAMNFVQFLDSKIGYIHQVIVTTFLDVFFLLKFGSNDEKCDSSPGHLISVKQSSTSCNTTTHEHGENHTLCIHPSACQDWATHSIEELVGNLPAYSSAS